MLDARLASQLFPRVGLGESVAPVRRRRNPEFHRDLVGEPAAALQPGRQLIGPWPILDRKSVV